MKVLPDQRTIAEHQQSGQTLGRGMDFALVVLVFLGIGYGLDRWLGTRPAFTIAAMQSQPRYKTDGRTADGQAA